MNDEYKNITVGQDEDGNGGDPYTIRLLPTTVFLQIQFEMDKEGMTPTLIKKAITNGVAIGSSEMTSDKYEKHFRGKRAMQVFDLFQNLMSFNLDPDGFDDLVNELGKEQEVLEEEQEEEVVLAAPKRKSKSNASKG